jgi:hypothetical protein
MQGQMWLGTYQDHMDQRLIQWSTEIPETNYASALAEGIRQGSAECKGDVLHRVVVVYPSVTSCIDSYVKKSMRADLLHMPLGQ